MTDPGWYHGAGDPVGTVRYWDGQAWLGEPQTPAAIEPAPVSAMAGAAASTSGVASSNGVTYYAAPENQHLLAGASAMEQAVAAVSVRTVSNKEPPPAELAPVPRQTSSIPASAQLVAIGLSALKAVPLVFVLLNTILIAVFGTVGLSFRYNEDVETVLALAVGMALLFIAIGTSLIMCQALGAARNRPVLMLVPALIMTAWDGLLTVGSWANDHGTDQFFYTGLFLLQGWVLIGAIIGLVKRS